MYEVKSIKSNNQTQYVLLKDGELHIVSCKFLKSLWVKGNSVNTQKAYAYGLKEYFSFLEITDTEYTDISMRTLHGFIEWLQDPTAGTNIVSMVKSEPKRKPQTVNLYISAVLSFYSYLYEIGIYDCDLSKYYLEDDSGPASYKGLLYGMSNNTSRKKNKLYVKNQKTKIRPLSKEEVKQLLNATTNSRDKFLLYLLFVSGLRIGEALSLYNEDVIYDQQDGHRVELHQRDVSENDAYLKTGERTVHINQKCINLYDEYQYDMLDLMNKDSNYVFVKLSGKNCGKPMEYQDVASLFNRLKQKTGINVYPHLLRHTHATIFYQNTKDPKALQERLGHSNIQTTNNMYVHPSLEEMRDDWETAEKGFDLNDND